MDTLKALEEAGGYDISKAEMPLCVYKGHDLVIDGHHRAAILFNMQADGRVPAREDSRPFPRDFDNCKKPCETGIDVELDVGSNLAHLNQYRVTLGEPPSTLERKNCLVNVVVTINGKNETHQVDAAHALVNPARRR